MNQETLLLIINNYLVPVISVVVAILSVVISAKKMGLFVDSETKELKQSVSNQVRLIDELRKENKMLKKALDIVVAEHRKIKIPDEE